MGYAGWILPAVSRSTAFGSPDYRELGSFDLTAGSRGTLGDSFSIYLSFGDF